jgi:eukaryotic-like serine/threonine-protein kinase
MSSLVNALIGEYLVTERVGAGGMGEVYKATHTHLGRVIAIKALTAGDADPQAVRRFYSEANIQASLRHPGVADYLGFYEYRGRPCILMEFVDGQTISDMIEQQGAFTPKEALRISLELVSAVANFHSRDVLHRDIKSSNVKINSAGVVKILDFGIARVTKTKNLTQTGMVVGTPGILAPEQIRGDGISSATDVWQLGVLMYEMLTGRMPFSGSNLGELYAQILNREFTPISKVTSVRGPVPPAFEKTVHRCLQKDPAKRFASGRELLTALQGGEQRKSAPEQPREEPKERRTLAAAVSSAKVPWLRVGVAVGAAVVFIALVIGVLRGYHPSAKNASLEACFDEKASSGDPMTVKVDTFEGSAQVFCKEELVGVTPLSVEAKIGDKIHVLLRRQGYRDLDQKFDVTERSVYTFMMDRAGER